MAAPPGRRTTPAGRPPASVRLARVDELEVRIEKLVEGGEGLARYEGIPVFVPRSAPGDLLRVRLTQKRTDYGRAEIVEVLEPGPGRRAPPCPHFERCGGCDLQHLDDSHQLRWKAEAVRETLKRLGGIEPPARVTVVPGAPLGYRLRTQLQVGETDRGTEVGYFARGSHDLVPVDRCPILVGDLERRLAGLPRALGDQQHRRIDLVAGDGGAWTASPVIPGLPQGEITTTVGGIVYGYDARCFFQAHRQLLGALVEHAVGDGEGEVDRDGVAVDLYAGVGLFSLPLARRYDRVVAVEGDRVAARYARNNARRNKLPNVEVASLAIDGWLRQGANRQLAPSRVVVDPPRAGLTGLATRWLYERRPARLTYVSCHAATLARDLKRLAEAYRLDSLALLDMFPQTGHMEVVAQLSAIPK